jgi:hypothetical protein
MNVSSATHLSVTNGKETRGAGDGVPGRKERVTGLLEERVETISGEFNSQDIANTLWAFLTMGRKPWKRTMGQLEERTETISGVFKSQDSWC